MNESNRQIKIGAIISYGAIAISIITSLFYLPWMTRQIGQSNYGLYTLANSFVTMFLMDFGLSSATARFLAKYRAENNREKANIVFSVIARLYLLIDVGICMILIVAYLFINRIYSGLTFDEIKIFRKLYIIVSVFSIISFPCMTFNGVLTAYEKFIEAKLCDLGQKLTAFILIAAALYHHMGVIAVVVANAASGLFFIIVKIVIILRKTRIRFRFALKDHEITKSILSFSVWTAVISICQRFFFNFAPTILGIVSNSQEIAVFSPANALEGYFYMFAAAVNGLFLTRISCYIAKNKEDQIYRLMVKVGRYQVFVMGLLLIGYLCVGHEFVIQWMGKDYERAYYCGIFLFIPDFLAFTQQIGNTAIIAKNKVKHSAIGYLISSMVCVVTSYYLGRYFGAIGVSIAIAVGYFISFMNVNRILNRYLGISIRKFFKECFGSFLVPGIAVCTIGIVMRKYVTISGWAGIGIKGMLIIMVYLLFMVRFALNEDEKMIIRKSVTHIRRGKDGSKIKRFFG